jgi:hypothetical protein
MLSKASLIMPSEGLALVHNLICGAFGYLNAGVDFFVNLPADVQKNVEAQDPAEVAWWWNN